MNINEPEVSPIAKQSMAHNFVDYIIAQCLKNKGLAARLRRADNIATEYQSWDTLALFSIDLENSYKRLPYAFIAASIAKSKAEKNGSLKLGRALALSFNEGKESDQAQMRLRRLLACSDQEELIKILRPLLALINGRQAQKLNYVSLLNDLLYFESDPQRTKARWAQQFYTKVNISQEKEAE